MFLCIMLIRKSTPLPFFIVFIFCCLFSTKSYYSAAATSWIPHEYLWNFISNEENIFFKLFFSTTSMYFFFMCNHHSSHISFYYWELKDIWQFGQMLHLPLLIKTNLICCTYLNDDTWSHYPLINNTTFISRGNSNFETSLCGWLAASTRYLQYTAFCIVWQQVWSLFLGMADGEMC